mgnify:CR=1 FL=1
MKSAYELAMERMRKEQGETRTLTDDQKKRIHAIEEACRAKVAEAKLSIESRLVTASMEERAELEQELADRVRRYEEQAERDKEAIWNEAG